MEVRSPAARRLALPGWLNARVAVGVLLVLLSALLGARVVAAADTSETVWAARHDLPVGYQVSAGDFTAVRVRLGAATARYVAASARPPAGYVLRRPVVAGELVPIDALAPPRTASPQRRVVAVPVATGHRPHDLAPGDLVDLYATRHAAAGAATPPPAVLVLAGVPVQSVSGSDRGVFGGGAGSGAPVELSVTVTDVPAVVSAVESSDIDLVRAGTPTPGGR